MRENYLPLEINLVAPFLELLSKIVSITAHVQ